MTGHGTVVFVWRRIPPPFLIGGAEVSQQLLAEQFTAAGWTTIYLASHEPPWSQASELSSMVRHLNGAGIAVDVLEKQQKFHYTWNGVDIRVVPQVHLLAELRRVLREVNPDLVVTSQEGSAELAATARPFTTVAGWLHSVSKTGFHVLDGKPQIALATSRFVCSRVPRSQAAVLFYPPFAPAAQAGPAVTGDLLMVNPVPAKGSALVRRLVEIMPERRFTLVEGWWDTSAEFAQLRNVTWVPRTYDMASLYTGHQILLVPSTVEDAFPRVVVEAGLHGLPSLGSTRGGIPEAIGNADLLAAPDDLEAWVALIRNLTGCALTVAAQRAREVAIPMTRPCISELIAMGVIAGQPA
ncbi:glycosyl transferase [Sphaerisporangium rufum]|uniref:Glycosyl transferase n=1 Tax=Sphaerisporangium rufum TaxID=1381558 RepID=A0A919R2F6_9ACTN|nr:glycosyltransferase [Sphaerisporangium rufum]GII78437.1 glycosyl transferase [Sphaerisporangium rufum]